MVSGAGVSVPCRVKAWMSSGHCVDEPSFFRLEVVVELAIALACYVHNLVADLTHWVIPSVLLIVVASIVVVLSAPSSLIGLISFSTATASATAAPMTPSIAATHNIRGDLVSCWQCRTEPHC